MVNSHYKLRRPNLFTISLGAIKHNLREIRKLVGFSTKIIAALKSNAYGFGLEEVTKVVTSEGVDAVALSDLSDASRVRSLNKKIPILLYAGNIVNSETVTAVQEMNIMPTITDLASAQFYSLGAKKIIKAYVKVDVGLMRFGFAQETASKFIEQISRLPRLKIQGVYTNMHVPADVSGDYIDWQLEQFFSIIRDIECIGMKIPVKLCASSAMLQYTRYLKLNAVDPGHFLFGLSVPVPRKISIDLKLAFSSLQTVLIQVKNVERKKFIHLAPIQMHDGLRIGVIPIGLRDGIQSLTSGEVLVRGCRAPIIGKYSLEYTRINLTKIPEAKVGDQVMIIGSQGNQLISPQQVITSQKFNISANLPLAIGNSVIRDYIN